MFTSYFDAGGGKDHGFIVVSGWVASLEQWERFESDWRLLLARYELTHFHMKECSQWSGQFECWKGNDGKRAQFLSLAVQIIKSYVSYGFSSLVEYEPFARFDQKYTLSEAIGNPYSFAGRTCIAKIQEHLRANNNGKLPDINFVFEEGDEGVGELIRVVQRDCGITPIFKPSRDRKHKKTGDVTTGVVQLQPADFAAYELRKAMISDPREEWMPWQHRKSIQALATIDAGWGIYREPDLLRFCQDASLVKLREGESD